jgi:hypothetical protein
MELNNNHVRLAQDFLQDFPGSNLITVDHVGKNRFFAEQITPARF